MKKLILLTLPLLIVGCSMSKVPPVENTEDMKVQPVIVPAEENKEEVKTEDKPQREILAKPKETRTEPKESDSKTDEMTQEIDTMIDNLISDL
jgi:hypothetical protein